MEGLVRRSVSGPFCFLHLEVLTWYMSHILSSFVKCRQANEAVEAAFCWILAKRSFYPVIQPKSSPHTPPIGMR